MAARTYIITKAVGTRREAFAKLGATAMAGLAATAIAIPKNLAQPIGDINHKAKPAGDTELLALITQFNDLEQTMAKSFDTLGPDDPDEVWEAAYIWPLVEQQGVLFERIVEIRATTLQGYRARAKMFFIWDQGLEFAAQEDGNEPAGWPERMRWALVRDLVGEDA